MPFLETGDWQSAAAIEKATNPEQLANVKNDADDLIAKISLAIQQQAIGPNTLNVLLDGLPQLPLSQDLEIRSTYCRCSLKKTVSFRYSSFPAVYRAILIFWSPCRCKRTARGLPQAPFSTDYLMVVC